MLTLWSVFFCEIQSLIVSTQVRTIQADEDEVQVLKPLQKPWTISLAQRWIREDRDQSKLIKNIYESQVDYCTTDIREVLSVVH